MTSDELSWFGLTDTHRWTDYDECPTNCYLSFDPRAPRQSIFSSPSLHLRQCQSDDDETGDMLHCLGLYWPQLHYLHLSCVDFLVHVSVLVVFLVSFSLTVTRAKDCLRPGLYHQSEEFVMKAVHSFWSPNQLVLIKLCFISQLKCMIICKIYAYSWCVILIFLLPLVSNSIESTWLNTAGHFPLSELL